MTKTVAALSRIRTDAACAGFQFTLCELIIFVAVTFLGMCVLVPRDVLREPVLAGVCIALAVASGALFGMSCCPLKSRGRVVWLLLGMAAAWIGVLGLGAAESVFNDATACRVGTTAIALMFALLSVLWLAARIAYRRQSARPAPALLSTLALFGVAAALTPACVAPQTYDASTPETESTIVMSDNANLALIDKVFGEAENTAAATPKSGYVFTVLCSDRPSPPINHLHGRAVTFKKPRWVAIDTTLRDQYMISNNGTIFQRDLGISTSQTQFNPSSGWGPPEQ
jgi:hypothetical protein